MKMFIVKKYIFKVAVFALSVCICVIFLCACVNPWFAKKMEQYSVEWRVDENDYGIDLAFVSLRKENNGSNNYGYIEYNNKRIEIVMEWFPLWFGICQITYYGENMSNYRKDNNNVPNNYIDGTPVSLSGDKIKLSFGSDYLFDGELNNVEIVVTPHKINPIDYGISLDNSVKWSNSEEKLSLITTTTMKNFSLGTYADREVMAIWEKDNKFKIYEIVDGVQQSDVICYGSYVYTGETVTLYFEENGISDSGEIVLNSCRDFIYEVPELYPTTDSVDIEDSV